MLQERELTYFKSHLLRLKQKMLEVIETNQSFSFEDYGELTAFDNHFADTASQLEDREIHYSVKDNAKHILDQVSEALDRIENGTFGKCVETGKDIPIDRLRAIPYTKRTIEAQQKFDNTAGSSPEMNLSFATPKDDQRGDERLQTVDELQYEHGNSSYRTN